MTETKHVNLTYSPLQDMELFRVPRKSKKVLLDGADWVTGNVLGMVDGFPMLVRMDANIEELALLGDIYDMADDYPWEAGGIRRANIGTYYGTSFGTVEPNALRRRYSVQRGLWSTEYPEFSALLEESVARGWAKLPQEYKTFIEEEPKAKKVWRIGDTPYTSGVINASITLPYHRDRGNVPSTGSLMWITRKLVKGGHLHIPELNIVIDCSHGALLAFYGEIFWHGVTLITETSRAGAGRYSIVAYAKNKVLKAGTPKQEFRKGLERAAASSEELRDTVLKYD